MSIFYFLFHFPPASLHLLLPRSLPRLGGGEELLLSATRDKSGVLSRRHSVRGSVAGADEISGAHLVAPYGDLLGRDEQQASHHSQPNRLLSCMCLFLLQWQEQRRCQGWSRPPRPCAAGSLALLSASLPSIRSSKQGCTAQLAQTLMASISEKPLIYNKVRPHIGCSPLHQRCTPAPGGVRHRSEAQRRSLLEVYWKFSSCLTAWRVSVWSSTLA